MISYLLNLEKSCQNNLKLDLELQYLFLHNHIQQEIDQWNQRRFGYKMKFNYRQTPNISLTKSENLNVSCLVLQLSFPNQLKPGFESEMKT